MNEKWNLLLRSIVTGIETLASGPFGCRKGGLTNFRGTALCPYYNVKSGKYTFETGVPEKRKRLFLEKNYYTVFRAEDLSTNPLMTQNPGYGN